MVVHGCVSLLKVHTFFSGKLKVHSLKKTQNPKHFIGHLHNSGETSVFESYHLTRKIVHIWKNCFSKKKSTTAPPNVFFVPSSFLGEKQKCFGASNWGESNPSILQTPGAPASGPSSRSPNIGRSWSLPSVAWGAGYGKLRIPLQEAIPWYSAHAEPRFFGLGKVVGPNPFS